MEDRRGRPLRVNGHLRHRGPHRGGVLEGRRSDLSRGSGSNPKPPKPAVKALTDEQKQQRDEMRLWHKVLGNAQAFLNISTCMCVYVYIHISFFVWSRPLRIYSSLYSFNEAIVVEWSNQVKDPVMRQYFAKLESREWGAATKKQWRTPSQGSRTTTWRCMRRGASRICR